MTKVKILGGLAAGVLLSGLTACAAAETGSDDSNSGNAAGKPDVTVKAAKMIKEFERNELRADAKYKGKVLRVSGVVNKIDTEMLDDKKYVLRVAGPGEYNILTVNCYGIPAKKLAAIDKGNRVTMVGKFKDGGDLGVEMEDCRLA